MRSALGTILLMAASSVATEERVMRARREVCHTVTKKPLTKRQRRRLRGKDTSHARQELEADHAGA